MQKSRAQKTCNVSAFIIHSSWPTRPCIKQVFGMATNSITIVNLRILIWNSLSKPTTLLRDAEISSSKRLFCCRPRAFHGEDLGNEFGLIFIRGRSVKSCGARTSKAAKSCLCFHACWRSTRVLLHEEFETNEKH